MATCQQTSKEKSPFHTGNQVVVAMKGLDSRP